jgi:alkanesulfonate monooxygenase SsuD/methylene tetrahydromethanopterin reductase-like flavin-dependent oxidoreductase (luciferase family)
MRMVPQIWTNDRFSWSDDAFQIRDAPIIPKPYQKPHPPLWQASSSPESFEMAARNGVGALGVTILTPLEGMAGLLEAYRGGIKDAEPAGSFINNQTGVFTFVHCAETTKQAIENGAAEAAAWYTNTIVKFFELQEMMKALEEQVSQPQDVAAADSWERSTRMMAIRRRTRRSTSSGVLRRVRRSPAKRSTRCWVSRTPSSSGTRKRCVAR